MIGEKMGDTFPKVKVAAVQAAPVFLNREKTLDKALSLIFEASRTGAGLIVFPEVFIAGYPYWNRLENVFKTTPFFIELLKHSVTVPGSTTTRLCEATKKAGIYLVMGINERPDNTLGTLYNTNLVIGPDGDILLKHRKLMPTYAEKLVWGFGDGSTLRVLDTPIGKLGTLICGENANPLARFAMIGQGEEIHASNYPAMPCEDYGAYNIGEDIQLRGAAHAFEGKVFNVVASSVIDATVIDILADTEEKRRILSGPQSSFTGVFAPGGKLISDTVCPGEEGIVYADCDIETIIGHKLRHDLAGQYNRFDVLALKLNRAPCTPIIETQSPAEPDDVSPDNETAAQAEG
jgi:aliphatic nitrilase